MVCYVMDVATGLAPRRSISLASVRFRGVDPAQYLAKAEAVLIHLINRPLARMALSSDQRPIVRGRPFVGPGSKPNGLCAFRQPIGFHLIDIVDWRAHSWLLTLVESLGLSRGQNGTRERRKLARYRASPLRGMMSDWLSAVAKGWTRTQM